MLKQRMATAQQIQDIQPMFGWCWPTVYNVGLTLSQHWFHVSCLLVVRLWCETSCYKFSLPVRGLVKLKKIREKLRLVRKHLETWKREKKPQNFQKNKNPSWGLTHPPTSEFFSDFGIFLTWQNPLRSSESLLQHISKIMTQISVNLPHVYSNRTDFGAFSCTIHDEYL